MKLLGRLLFVAVALFAVNGHAADYYVAWDNPTPDYPFTNGWGSAASNIQDAVNAAVEDSTVWVAAGTYSVPTNAVEYLGTNVVYLNKPITLRSASGNPADTIIDGENTNRVLVMAFSGGTRRNVIIDGFTLTRGYATSGAGIYMVPNTYTNCVLNCVISSNTATGGGGGIYNPENFNNFHMIISNCTIRGNHADGAGGGIYSYIRRAGWGGLLTHSLVEENTTGGYGGGVLFNTGNPFYIHNCTIRNNTSGSTGGGIRVRGGNSVIRNTLVFNNTGSGGGGMYFENGIVSSIENCTVVSNNPTTSGIRGQEAGVHLSFLNTIVYDNNVVGNGTRAYTNCCLDPAIVVETGTNNFTDDPAFIDVDNENFQLERGSPCVNSGTNEAWMIGTADLLGNPRIDWGTVDRGCYEHVTYGTRITVQ